jgi:hypothetical protein
MDDMSLFEARVSINSFTPTIFSDEQQDNNVDVEIDVVAEIDVERQHVLMRRVFQFSRKLYQNYRMDYDCGFRKNTMLVDAMIAVQHGSRTIKQMDAFLRGWHGERKAARLAEETEARAFQAQEQEQVEEEWSQTAEWLADVADTVSGEGETDIKEMVHSVLRHVESDNEQLYAVSQDLVHSCGVLEKELTSMLNHSKCVLLGGESLKQEITETTQSVQALLRDFMSKVDKIKEVLKNAQQQDVQHPPKGHPTSGPDDAGSACPNLDKILAKRALENNRLDQILEQVSSTLGRAMDHKSPQRIRCLVRSDSSMSMRSNMGEPNSSVSEVIMGFDPITGKWVPIEDQNISGEVSELTNIVVEEQNNIVIVEGIPECDDVSEDLSQCSADHDRPKGAMRPPTPGHTSAAESFGILLTSDVPHKWSPPPGRSFREQRDEDACLREGINHMKWRTSKHVPPRPDLSTPSFLKQKRMLSLCKSLPISPRSPGFAVQPGFFMRACKSQEVDMHGLGELPSLREKPSPLRRTPREDPRLQGLQARRCDPLDTRSLFQKLQAVEASGASGKQLISGTTSRPSQSKLLFTARHVLNINLPGH